MISESFSSDPDMIFTEEDYGIYVTYKGQSEKSEWLEDTKRLSNYKLLKDEVNLPSLFLPLIFCRLC